MLQARSPAEQWEQGPRAGAGAGVVAPRSGGGWVRGGRCARRGGFEGGGTGSAAAAALAVGSGTGTGTSGGAVTSLLALGPWGTSWASASVDTSGPRFAVGGAVSPDHAAAATIPAPSNDAATTSAIVRARLGCALGAGSRGSLPPSGAPKGNSGGQALLCGITPGGDTVRSVGASVRSLVSGVLGEGWGGNAGERVVSAASENRWDSSRLAMIRQTRSRGGSLG